MLIHHSGPNGAPGRIQIIQGPKDNIGYFERTFPPPLPSPISVTSLADHPVVSRRPSARLMLEMLADEWLLLQAMYWRWGDRVQEREHFEEQSKLSIV